MRKFLSILLATCLCVTCIGTAALTEQTALPSSALSSLANNCPNTGIMLPEEFNPNVYTYLLTVASWVSRVTFTPVSVDPDATIDISGLQISSGQTSQVFNMTDEPQMVTITVTASNQEKSVYGIFLQRRPSTERTRVSAGYLSDISVKDGKTYLVMDLVTVSFTEGNADSFTNDAKPDHFSYPVTDECIDAFDMFQGNQNGIAKLQLPLGAPRDIEAVLGEQLTDAYLTQGSFNGSGRTAMYHGHGGAKPEIDKDTEKFFRYVDRFVLETYSKPSKLPLILVALKEHHATFTEVSDNPYLLPEGIRGEYSAFSLEQLREKTWEILEPMYLAKMKRYVERFEQAKANGNGTDSLVLISKAIFENRVDTLFVDVDRIIPGKISLKDGKVLDRNLANPDIGDVLDELAQLALRGGSDVVVLPSALMPGETGIAAIFRY